MVVAATAVTVADLLAAAQAVVAAMVAVAAVAIDKIVRAEAENPRSILDSPELPDRLEVREDFCFEAEFAEHTSAANRIDRTRPCLM